MPSLLLFMLAGNTTTAQASDATVKACARYALEFVDADSGVGDDYLTSTDPIPARGAYIWVSESGVHGGSIVASGYADDAGTDLGCISVPIDYNTGYAIHLKSIASVSGNTVEVRHNTTTNSYFSATWLWTPTDSSDKTITTGTGDQWDIMAAASEAAYHVTGGLSGVTWRWYNQTCPSNPYRPNCIGHYAPDDLWVAFACHNGDTGCTANVAPALHKYEIGHQMGHLSSLFSSPGQYIPALSSGATPGGSCSGGALGQGGHMINSDEYQSQAAYDGMADTWAAMAFNQVSLASDCHFAAFTSVNWDNTLTTDNLWFRCGGSNICTYPDTCDDHTIDGADYQGDECGGVAGHAVEVDWLRFWWDELTHRGVDDADILDIWGGADPHTWFEGSDTGVPDTGTPPQRLRSSAISGGYITGGSWDSDATTNGVNR